MLNKDTTDYLLQVGSVVLIIIGILVACDSYLNRDIPNTPNTCAKYDDGNRQQVFL